MVRSTSLMLGFDMSTMCCSDNSRLHCNERHHKTTAPLFQCPWAIAPGLALEVR